MIRKDEIITFKRSNVGQWILYIKIVFKWFYFLRENFLLKQHSINTSFKKNVHVNTSKMQFFLARNAEQMENNVP